MSPEYKKLLNEDGIIVIKNLLTKGEISILRNEAEKNSLKNDFFSLSILGRNIATRIIKFLDEEIGTGYYYIGESHAAYNSTDNARVWHKDLRGDFSKENNPLNILRALIYLQDHKNYSYGTKIIKKSHKQTLYPFWSIKYFIKTLLETIVLLKKGNINYKNLAPVNIFKATNLEVEPGDIAIWSLNIIHSGNYVRLKIFPNLVLPVFLDKFLDKYLKKFIKIDETKRAIVSFTFGKKCLTTTNYISERISKNSIPSNYLSSNFNHNSLS